MAGYGAGPCPRYTTVATWGVTGSKPPIVATGAPRRDRRKDETSVNDKVRTVELGQFEDDNAQLIAAALKEAGIVWWSKGSGRFARMLFAGEWGTRLYVDAARLDEARQLAADILGR